MTGETGSAVLMGTLWRAVPESFARKPAGFAPEPALTVRNSSVFVPAVKPFVSVKLWLKPPKPEKAMPVSAPLNSTFVRSLSTEKFITRFAPPSA